MTAHVDVGSLFRASLAEFIAARNALASSLKKAGHADEAARVKAIAKPSVSAWIVNQLYWREQATYDALIAAGDALRRAQHGHLTGGAGGRESLQAVSEARDRALARALGAALDLATSSGHGASADVRDRVSATLGALATYGSARADPPGHLTADVEPPGMSVLATLAPPPDDEPAPSTLRLVPSPQPPAVPPVAPAKARPRASGAADPPSPPAVSARARLDLERRENELAALRDECARAEKDAVAHRAHLAIASREHAEVVAALERTTRQLQEIEQERQRLDTRARELDRDVRRTASAVESDGVVVQSLRQRVETAERALARERQRLGLP
ncbi:MAG: hypothetical protein U0Q12_26525 [Vicinamibacterales bacterium]